MKLVIFKRKITIFFSDDILHQFSLLTTQSDIYYQVNYLFLVKNMVTFLLLAKLKCHNNFHCVVYILKEPLRPLVTSTANPEFICPKYGFFPDGGNCKAYYQCDFKG